MRVPDPDAVAARWGEVLGLEPDGTTLRLDRDQRVAFEQGDEGLSEIAVELPGGATEPLAFGAARVVSTSDRSSTMPSVGTLMRWRRPRIARSF